VTETPVRRAAPPSHDARAALSRLAFVPGWLVVGATTAAFLLGASLSLTAQLVPLAVSVVLLGLPHGAVDHLALPRTRNEGVTPRWLAVVGVVYLVAGAAYAAVWFLAPAVAFAVFVGLTWAHWGQGELYPLVALADARHLADRPRRLLTATTRGALPMLVPLVAFPEQYELVATTLVGLVDAGAADALSVAFTPTARLAVGAAVATLVVVTLGAGLLTGERRRVWALDAGETLLLVAFFAVVPPVFAVGLYFCAWHSLRHVVRLLAVDEGAVAALEAGGYGVALARFVRDAAPLTVGALALFGVLYRLLPAPGASPLELVGAYLVLIAVLTLPHVIVVSWMDREQGVWTPGAG